MNIKKAKFRINIGHMEIIIWGKSKPLVGNTITKEMVNNL